MRDNDELDSILDAALASYADREPAPDLAAKILANVTGLPARQTRWGSRRESGWKSWTIAVPAAAAAILLLFLIPLRHASRKPAATTTATTGSSIASEPSQTANTPHIARLQPSIARRRTRLGRSFTPVSLPKQEVFPIPQPLTPEEEALVSLAHKNPGEAAQSLSENQKPPVEPLKIAGIHIPPLVPPDQGGN